MKTKLKKIGAYLAALLVLATLVSGANMLFAQNATGTEEAAADPEVISIDTSKDTTLPSDVEGLKATAGDSEVLLEWAASTDNKAVTSYKIYRGTRSVKTKDDQYDLPAIPVGAVTRYTVKNLTNDQTYYFSATASDAAGNESLKYALEATATPKSGLRLAAASESDGKAPQVKEVKSEDLITVLVVFSEPVNLPEEHPASAFTVQKSTDKARLEVQKAEVDARDSTGATVLLTTAPQEANVDYLLTAGIEVQDKSGIPVSSGTSDTGSFKGSAKKSTRVVASIAPVAPTPPAAESGAAAGDKDPPKVIGGKADFNNAMAINFSEKIVLPENPKEHFKVSKKGTAEVLKVVNVSLSVDGKTAFVTTDAQKAVEYEVKISGVKDVAGNDIAAETTTVTVTGKGASLEDLVPPEDVTNLIAKIKDAKKNIVELTWEASKNSAGDLADQSLYQSDDKEGKKYGAPAALGADTLAAEVEDLEPGNWYTFKVTTKDEVGNESKGAFTSIFLPETGPGAVAAGLTALMMGWYSRKKKKQ